MSRQISINAINALLSKKKFRCNNTEVKYNRESCTLYLHGNPIIEYFYKINKVGITLCNYNTKVTRERLNALPNVYVKVVKEKLYLNGKEWDGKGILINL